MGTKWFRMFANLWRRVGVELVRPWRSEERLHLSVPAVCDDPYHFLADWDLHYCASGDVVSLLGGSNGTQRGVREDHRPRSVDGDGAGARSDSRIVEGGGATCQTFSRDGDDAGYVDSTSGSWTLMVDCE